MTQLNKRVEKSARHGNSLHRRIKTQPVLLGDKRMSDIFISYNNKDKDKAKLFATLLKQHGWSVFWDKNIPPGKTFDEYISEQLDAAKCIIVLWSKNSVNSDWVKEEAQRGASRKVLVPIFIERVSPPLGFGRIEAAELFDWNGDSDEVEFQNLLQAITQLIPESEHAPRPRQPLTKPAPENISTADTEPVKNAKHGSGKEEKTTLLRWLPGLAVPLVIAATWYTWKASQPEVYFPQHSLGVVFGSDRSLADAKNEINRRTSNEGIPKAKTAIFLRNGYYASIALADNQEEADKYLSIAKTFDQGAYPAKMESWCRNPQRGDGFVTCQSDSTKP